MGGLLCASSAHAADRLLLLEDSSQPGAGLAGALSVQLLGVAELEVHPPPALPTVSLRISRARLLAQERAALLVVWAEGPQTMDDGSEEAVLYAVGQREGRALLEVVRVPGGKGPDMDRTLALKVREMVDELHRHAAQAPTEAMLQPEPAAAVPAQASRVGATLALGALAGPGLGSQPARFGAELAAGPSLLLHGSRFSALAQLGWFPPDSVQRDRSHVSFAELMPGLSLSSQLRAGALWLGARSGFALALTSATGESAAGTRGERHEQTALWQLALELELPVGAGLGLRAALELYTRFVRRRLTINDATIVDLGRVNPLLSIALTWSVPPPE